MCLNSRYICRSVSCNASVLPGVSETLKRQYSGVFAKLLMRFFLNYNLNYSGFKNLVNWVLIDWWQQPTVHGD